MKLTKKDPEENKKCDCGGRVMVKGMCARCYLRSVREFQNKSRQIETVIGEKKVDDSDTSAKRD